MMRTQEKVCRGIVLSLVLLCLSRAAAESFTNVVIVPGERATAVEQKAGQLLAERMRRQCAVEVRIGSEEAAAANDLVIYLGTPERHGRIAALCRAEKAPLPDRKDPGAEGFVLKSLRRGGHSALLAAGVDERGVLYAVGEILRRSVNRGTAIEIPTNLDVRTAPAFRYRGLNVSQGVTITQLTGARAWTDEEWQQVVVDYVLAGANTFEVGHVTAIGPGQKEFIKSYGLHVLLTIGPNIGSGPPEWEAMEAIGRKNYLCLSIPEARQAILDRWESNVRNGFDYDIARFAAGDGGGCECEKCAPYGKKYIEMCADIARIILKQRPNTVFFATNQKLDNAGDQAILDYLNAEPRPWLYALCYGPGSNAMGWQPGRRQDHRMDLFEYPAFGPTDRYIRELLHQLPPSQKLVFFTDVTHWVYSQYGLVSAMLGPDRNGNVPPHWSYGAYEQHPDPALNQVYDRRTFHARPQRYYDTFQETLRYGEGDVTYSEGHHDQFNQWMWQRLLWDPHMTLDGVIEEYARTWFGPEAAPLMAQALLQLEQNLSTPIAGNEGVDRYYGLVKEAGSKMPEWTMKTNYLWRQHMQKAALDKHIQLRVRQQTQCQDDLERLVSESLGRGDLAAAVEQARAKLAALGDTEEMKRLKEEAAKLGEESAALFGVRSEGYFSLERDFVGLGWIDKQLDAALSAPADRQRELLTQIVRYEDPGEGGFYDDAGDPARSPHLTYGWPFSDASASGANRPSQRTVAYTRDEKQGVTFEYDGLDPNAGYRVRFTFVRPNYAPRFADKQPQKTQSVYVDDHLLVKDLELPATEAQFFEYDIPPEVTRDGKLQLRLEKSAGVGEGPASKVTVWRNTGGWGTLVSEVWLMKRK